MTDRFFQIHEDEIRIPDLTKEYHLLQISDTHICACDAQSSPEEIRQAEEWEESWKETKKFFAGLAGEYFGSEQELSTVEAFRKLMRYAAEEKPDLLVLAGDLLESMHPAGERLLRQALQEYPGQYLCVAGNHEEEYLEGVWESKPRLVQFEGFQLLAVDDRIKTVSEETLDVLRSIVQKPVPTIIVTHIPLCTDRNREDLGLFQPYFFIDENSEDANAAEFVRLIRDNACFVAVLCGHLHGYLKTMISEDKYQVCSSQGMIGAVNKIRICG
ncbi:MAG: metallophosphoesterase [Solobacterium sp.]|nr:metallophosphoesterase [Solobacterium sp.]